MAYVVEQSNDTDVVATPEVKLTTVKYNVGELTQVRFEDAEQGDVAGVVATASAPRLTETCAQVCDPVRFAEEAGLTPGQSVTVVLVIEVLADGSTGSTNIAMSSGNSATDAIAIQYARSLRWIPGTRNRQALSMRIRFPVTLARAIS
jgi:TonB family protein